MNQISPKLREEKGMVLITALLIMLVLTLIGMAAIMNSTVEINLSRNERLQKEAFFVADSGSAIASRVIRYYLQNQPDPGGYPDNLPEDIKGIMMDSNFLSEINGNLQEDNCWNSPDLHLTTQGRMLDIDIDYVGRVLTSRQNIVFLNEDGVPSPVTIYYRVHSRGRATNNSSIEIETFYRYLPTY